MKLLKLAIHTALRDDNDPVVGMRTLLGQSTTTPYGVYQGRWQGPPNFKNANGPQAYLTWLFLQGTSTGTVQSDLRLREQVFAVTAWSENSDNLEDILRRARFVLEGMGRTSLPTNDVELHQIRHEGCGPDLFDDKFKVYYRAEHFRAYYREDIEYIQIPEPNQTIGPSYSRPQPSLGTWYYSVDLGVLEFSDGVAWHVVFTG